MRIGSHAGILIDAFRKYSTQHADKKRFLDIGCGSGNRTVLFEMPGRTLAGFDVSDWRLPELKGRFEYRMGDFLHQPLPWPDGSFDLLFSFDVIEHIPEPRRLLTEARRLLAPGGRFLLGTPNRFRPAGALLIPLGLRRFPMPVSPGFEHTPYSPHLWEYRPGELARLCEGEGFRVCRMQRLFYGVTSQLGIDRLGPLPFCHNLLVELEPR